MNTRTLLPTLLLAVVAGAATPYEEAYALYSAGKYEEALQRLKPLLDQKVPEACNLIGIMCAQGHGVLKEPEKAAAWYRTAKDEVSAFGWMKRSAELGNGSAMYDLALMYEEGRGTPPDAAEAKRWLTSAAQQGHEAAKKRLGQ